jgi:hypothetical protein
MSEQSMASGEAAVESNESIEAELAQAEAELSQNKAADEIQKQAEVSSKKKYKLKVDGEEIEDEIDLANEQEIVKRLQLAKAAQKRMQEAAQYRKQIEETEQDLSEFLEQLKQNPLAVLKHPDLGLDLRQVVESFLEEEVERSKKSPEQIELEEAKARLRALEEEKESLETQRREEYMERLRVEKATEIEKELIEALDAGDLPQSDYIMNKMVDLASIAYDNGIEISMKELLPIVRDSYLKDARQIFGKLPDELIEDIVSKDRIRNIRNKQLQTLKNQQKPGVKVVDTGKKTESKEEKKQSAKDFFKDAW